MKLKTISRISMRKSDKNRLRREGFVPAILYIKGDAGQPLAISKVDFDAALRQMAPSYLPTTVFTLVDEEGKERRVLVKEIQYAVTTYAVIHLDLEELIPGQQINVKVPIDYINKVECEGVKLGGVLREVVRHARVSCLAEDLPTVFYLDVKDLGLRQSRRISDLTIPETVRLITNPDQVVVAVVKR